MINPEIKIPDFIQKLTSIRPKHLSGAPKIEEIIDDILEFMGDSILVAHNTSFDIPFFNSVLKRLGKPPLKNKNICTNLMTKYLIPNLMNSNLRYMCRIFNIPHKKAHRALDDAHATAKLFIKYLQIFIQKKITKINHLYYPKNKYELDRIHFRKNDKKRWKDVFKYIDDIETPFLVTLKGKNGTILFSLPCDNSAMGIELIKANIESLPWEIATFRLFGHFFETLIHFHPLFNMLDKTTASKIMTLLKKNHLGTAIDSKAQLPDFIVIAHIVPEQFLIYPTNSLTIKSGLIFRYPAHKKKFTQYIKSKSSKMRRQKTPLLIQKNTCDEFIIKLLGQYYNKPKKHLNVLSFQQEYVKNSEEQFTQGLENFLSQSKNTYNYPAKHI